MRPKENTGKNPDGSQPVKNEAQGSKRSKQNLILMNMREDEVLSNKCRGDRKTG